MAAIRAKRKTASGVKGGARRARAQASALEKAGLKPGRSAVVSTILIAALGIGLYAWSQTPWSGTIAAKQSEWKITLSAATHTAGDVTFDLSNRGTIPHEFIVVATDKTAKELLSDIDPTTNRIDEEKIDVVGEQPEYGAATTSELTLALPEGHYVVMCNIEGHYKNGMYADLTVTAAPDGKVVTRTPAPVPTPAVGPINGAEKEWEIALDSSLHEAGTVAFHLTNAGTIAHEFLVVRTDRSAADLVSSVDPTTNRIDEALLDVVNEQPEYNPGVPGAVTVDLLPGHYVVMCNIEGHYKAGMHADLEIVPATVATANVSGTEKEWNIALDSYTHAAGSITFNLSNAGTIAHEFLVVRTDSFASELLASVDPTTNRIDEALLDVVNEQPEYNPGVPGSVTVDLAPGHYVVMCNIPGHYKAGMYSDFDVVTN
ncbi:MAG: sulfocyanin-like copper-binding protein [Chloroflexota bacterium]